MLYGYIWPHLSIDVTKEMTRQVTLVTLAANSLCLSLVPSRFGLTARLGLRDLGDSIRSLLYRDS